MAGLLIEALQDKKEKNYLKALLMGGGIGSIAGLGTKAVGDISLGSLGEKERNAISGGRGEPTALDRWEASRQGDMSAWDSDWIPHQIPNSNPRPESEQPKKDSDNKSKSETKKTSSIAIGVGSGLLGSALGAGLLHTFADEENKTLLNYLLAAGAGAGVGSGSGLLAYNLADSIKFHAKNPGATPADAIPGAIADETEEAEKARKK